MNNIKKAITLSLTGFAIIGCVTLGASALNSPDNATSGSVDISSNQLNETHHEQVGGGDWWWGINFQSWAYSDYQHRTQEHGSSVYGMTYCDSHWQNPDTIAKAGSVRNAFGKTTCNWRTR